MSETGEHECQCGRICMGREDAKDAEIARLRAELQASEAGAEQCEDAMDNLARKLTQAESREQWISGCCSTPCWDRALLEPDES